MVLTWSRVDPPLGPDPGLAIFGGFSASECGHRAQWSPLRAGAAFEGVSGTSQKVSAAMPLAPRKSRSGFHDALFK